MRRDVVRELLPGNRDGAVAGRDQERGGVRTLPAVALEYFEEVHTLNFRLFIPETVDRIELRRPPGGIESEEHADDGRKREGRDRRAGLDQDRPVLDRPDRLRARNADHDADRPADG